MSLCKLRHTGRHLLMRVGNAMVRLLAPNALYGIDKSGAADVMFTFASLGVWCDIFSSN